MKSGEFRPARVSQRSCESGEFRAARVSKRSSDSLRSWRNRLSTLPPACWRSALCGLVLVAIATVGFADLAPWVQRVPAGPLIAVFFRSVALPYGSVAIRRPPAETRPALTHLIAAQPHEAALYRLRAREAETAVDFVAAEADWRAYVRTSPDSYSANLELADYYDRRARPREELSPLMAATHAKDDPVKPATSQRAWLAFDRMAKLVETDRLPLITGEPVFRTWVARYPKEPIAHRRLIDYLTAHKQYAAAEAAIAAYGTAFHDPLATLDMRAGLELQRGAPEAAIRLYDQAFDPRWPDETSARFVQVLDQQGKLREFSGRARTALEATPTDLDAAARMFHYYRSQKTPGADRRVLLEFRLAKEAAKQPWSAQELETIADLFQRVNDANEAARAWYALYSTPPANGVHVERALAGLAGLLLNSSDQPISFGSGDLSFYRDVATVDPSPGFLNGILSLILNGTAPRWEYERENQKSASYFHRAAAARLIALLEQRFPNSPHRAALRADLISAYAVYGDDTTVIRAGRAWLAEFPSGAERLRVALLVAGALARNHRENEEFALYDQLLRELARKASGMPAAAKSAEYAQVLDQYLARLAALERPMDALRVYRTEIDRNPNDPGLYERLAAFLDQNHLSKDLEDLYAKAIARFQDRSWYHRLARWYLRNREDAALEKVTRQVVAIFSDEELESYFADVVSAHPDASLYLQLNLYAHERFPEDLVFVHNLITAYSRKETADSTAYSRLLGQYWFYDAAFRTEWFRNLSAGGNIYPQLSEIRKTNAGIGGDCAQALAANPAAAQFATEAEGWLSHFEAAAPCAHALATAFPGRREFTERASSLYRSLAAYDPRDTGISASIAQLEVRANPKDPDLLAKVGDIYADRELFARARPFWERMPLTQPANPQGYLDAATVYWDYYRFNDALRWISAARREFADPTLFSYQAGAIYENRRDYRRAVGEYVAGALAGQEQSKHRLMRLSERSQMRGLVDQATEAALAGKSSREALELRIEVLEVQQRRKDLQTLLENRLATESSPQTLTELQEVARRQGFDEIELRAAERLVAVTNDPVDRMRLTLAAVRLHEARKDLAGAGAMLDALYRSHPLILGVVRGAADFHERNHQYAGAIDILLDAARHANQELAGQFTLEAARDAAEAGEFDRSRTLLAGLLAADPFRAEYLTAMADTYLRAGDDRGFREYQLATIRALQQSPLDRATRIERIAAMRRSLIPVLGRMGDYPGAVAQYIELINSYPEDLALTREAASFALAHSRSGDLLAFYRKTVSDAPLDYRWPIVLGRIETVTEDYPAAITDYQKALKLRPNRPDVLEAEGQLEERLMRFRDAIKTYTRLYELSYRDSEWLVKVAELHARSGQTTEAVAALKTAIIGARSETADADFEIAGHLESWHIFPDAVLFCERGAALVPDDKFMAAEGGHAAEWARIMARARRMDAVLPRFGHDQPAEAAMAGAAGAVISELYTAEEKAKLEQALIARAASLPRLARDRSLLPLAAAAGMSDLNAKWLYESMLAQGTSVDGAFTRLQSERGLYGELGRQLEQFAVQNAGRQVESAALNQAAQAFIAEGDMPGQMRAMRAALDRHELGGVLLDRYLGLLAAGQPQELLNIIRGNYSFTVRSRAVQFAIAQDKPPQAYAAVRTMGASLKPVWTNAYTALAGVYLDDHSPEVERAFTGALDTRTIGDRLRSPLSPDAAIVGSVWFYYGARYGEYLTAANRAGADAYLPASVEAAPGNPEAYLALGSFLASAGRGAQAIAQFERVLQLDTDRGEAHDFIARVLWTEGRHTDAVARWRTAISAFIRVQSRGVAVPESFWRQVGQCYTAIGERHALGSLRPDIERQLRDYIQRNDGYRLGELIEAAARASLASGEDVQWLLDLGRDTQTISTVISSLQLLPGFSPQQRIVFQRELVALTSRELQAAFGDRRQSLDNQLAAFRLQLINLLLDNGDVRGAEAEWKLLPVDAREATYEAYQYVPVQVRLASQSGTLQALIERYRSEPEKAPLFDVLRDTAADLRRRGDEPAALAVMGFMYDRELRAGHLDASNFLGMAEVDLQRKEDAAAVALLHRMALVVTDGFDTLVPAADLLLKFGKTTDAAVFLEQRVKAVPWDAEARVRVARLRSGAERDTLLASVAADAQAAYKVRAEAARLSAPHVIGEPGTELALLSGGNVTPAAAARPFYVAARAAAANASSADPATAFRVWREALAISPDDPAVRLGAIRAAIATRSDSLAIAITSAAQSPEPENGVYYRRYSRYETPRYQPPPPILPSIEMTDSERAAIAESLAAAAERLDDLAAAQEFLRAAVDLRRPAKQLALEQKLDALHAEQERRTANAARQPFIKAVIEQDHPVRPRIPRSAQ